ncbi:Autophagy protein [Entamoeba marina]
MTKIQTTDLDLQIDVTFWHEFTKKKLEVLKLSEKPLPIFASVQGGTNVIRLSHSSFEAHQPCIPGELINFNTLTAFKEADKKKLFNDFITRCDQLYNTDLTTPLRFLLIAYGDLKKYDFHFIGGCPTYKPHEVTVEIKPYEPSPEVLQSLQNGPIVQTTSLTPLTKETTEAFVLDLSPLSNIPSWPVRTLLHNKLTTIHCIRPQNSFTLSINHQTEPNNSMTGWFKVASTGKIMTQIHHLAESMNPETLATQAVELNLQLMKWQLFRSLDLPLIQRTKALLVGAGTLGCNVARALMGWGFQDITFIDNGIVSYSNPVRQSLYNFNDCSSAQKKAPRAAEALKEIFPGMKTQGIVATIPMPGHPIGEKEIDGTRKTVESLDKLVQETDVVFLLGDSRECRWLPSMLASVHNKLCITVGLGFDSYVVMRHGLCCDEESNPKIDVNDESNPKINSNKLSCYFCADIVAPTDSLSRRTLDQQCTVTRPGVSFMAAALAVEMLVSLLHHPKGFLAPTGKGGVPHQLRGYLNTWNIEEGVGSAYSKCIACSSNIKEEYKKNSVDMVLAAINDPKTLENIAGIPQAIPLDDIEILTDSEDI